MSKIKKYKINELEENKETRLKIYEHNRSNILTFTITRIAKSI